jgi:hypothetical protein
MLLKLTPLVCFAVSLFAGQGPAGQDQAFRGLLSGMAQKAAREQAKKTKLPINHGGFQGQLEMPYPEKIQLDVTSFQLKNDTITASALVQGDCRISGIWTRDGQAINVKADVSVKLSVTGTARLEMQQNDFFLAPTLTDCDFKILRMSIQEPAEMAGGDTMLIQIANTAFQRNKAAIISQINRSLTKYPIKL